METQVNFHDKTKVDDGEFFFGFMKSIAAHIAVVILIVASKLLFDQFMPEIDFKPSKVQIIQSSVKVDVVGMPKYTLQELKQMTMDDFQPKPEVEKVEDSGGSEKVKFEKKAKKVNIGNLLSGYSNRKLKAPKRKKKKLNLNTRQLKNLVLEGNKVSEGNALVGDSNAKGDMSAFAKYANNLPNVIRPFWKLPSYLLNQKLKCRIRVFISSEGVLESASIYESSGNDEYDSRAMSAVKSVKKYPAPKESFSKLVRNGSIILGFPL